MAVWKDTTLDADAKAYGVICEWKTEGPLIMEGEPSTYSDAFDRARKMAENPHCIRVAVFSMRVEWGNGTIIPKPEGCK